MKLEHKFEEIKDGFTDFIGKLFYPSSKRKLTIPFISKSRITAEKKTDILNFITNKKAQINELVAIEGIAGVVKLVKKLLNLKYSKSEILDLLSIIDSINIIESQYITKWNKTLNYFRRISNFTLSFYIIERGASNIVVYAYIKDDNKNLGISIIDFISYAFYSRTLLLIFKFIIRESIQSIKRMLNITSLKEVEIDQFSSNMRIIYINFRKLIQDLQPEDIRGQRIIQALRREYIQSQRQELEMEEEELDIPKEEEVDYEETIAKGVDPEKERKIEPMLIEELTEIIKYSLESIDNFLPIVELDPVFSSYTESLLELKKKFIEWEEDLQKQYNDDPLNATIQIIGLREALASLSLELLRKLEKRSSGKITTGLEIIQDALNQTALLLYKENIASELKKFDDIYRIFEIEIKNKTLKLVGIKELNVLEEEIEELKSNIKNLIDLYTNITIQSINDQIRFLQKKLEYGAGILIEGIEELATEEETNPIESEAEEPEVGEPEAGEPAAEPEAGEPEAGEPEAGEPEAGEPEAGEPAAEPEAGEPAAEPEAGEPEAGEPAAGEPAAGEPAAEPEAGEPEAGEPAAEPEAGEPAAEPQAGEPAAEPQAGQQPPDLELFKEVDGEEQDGDFPIEPPLDTEDLIEEQEKEEEKEQQTEEERMEKEKELEKELEREQRGQRGETSEEDLERETTEPESGELEESGLQQEKGEPETKLKKTEGEEHKAGAKTDKDEEEEEEEETPVETSEKGKVKTRKTRVQTDVIPVPNSPNELIKYFKEEGINVDSYPHPIMEDVILIDLELAGKEVQLAVNEDDIRAGVVTMLSPEAKDRVTNLNEILTYL
ncbi:MAG: hypothetical protein ACFFDB_00270 [Promethearchaeota archaeon]